MGFFSRKEDEPTDAPVPAPATTIGDVLSVYLEAKGGHVYGGVTMTNKATFYLSEEYTRELLREISGHIVEHMRRELAKLPE